MIDCEENKKGNFSMEDILKSMELLSRKNDFPKSFEYRGIMLDYYLSNAYVKHQMKLSKSKDEWPSIGDFINSCKSLGIEVFLNEETIKSYLDRMYKQLIGNIS
jgi:hypothetical protein